MRWIGQQIYDLISRFRNKVFLESVNLGVIEPDSVLGLDANNMIVKNGSPTPTYVKTTGVTTNSDLPVTFVSNPGTYNNNSLLVSSGILVNPGTTELRIQTGDIMNLTSIMPGHAQLWNTDNNANPATLKFYKKRKDGTGVNDNVAAVDGDQVGSITWFGTDAQTSPQWWREYATIIGSIEEGDQGDECGKLTLKVGNNNTPTDGLVLTGNKTTAGQVDVTIGSSPTSQTTINGDVTIQNTADDNARPVLKLFNNRASGNSDGGATGEIHFSGKDHQNPSNELLYGMIECTAIDVTATTEDSRITFYNKFNGNLVNKLILAEHGNENVVTGDSRFFGYGRFNDYVRITETASGSQQPRLMLDYSDNTVGQNDPLGKVEWYNPDCEENTIEIRGVAEDSHSTATVGGTELHFGDSRIEFWTREAIGPNDYNYNGSSQTSELTKAMTISHDNIVTLEHELVVKGNKIKDDDDVACITFDSSGNTTIAGTTSGTFSGNLTGNVTGNVSGSSGSCTGNAATATTASSATSAGVCKNVVGNTNTDVNISSEKDVIVTIDSDNDSSQNFKIKNSSSDLFVVNETGSINFSGTALTNVNTGAAQLDIQTDGNVNFTIDRGNNSTGNYFSFINYNQEIARLTESGDLRLEGSQLSNSATASNFDIISSRVLKLQHAGSFDIELGNSTNQDVLKVEGNSETVTVNGALNTTGLITGKQRQVYSQSFFDDLGTGKHYIPWKSVQEQTTIYQEESAMVMPCDGRIVSVSVRVQFPNADGDITIGVHTCPVNVSTFVNNFTNNWIEEETELLPLVNADDNHLFHFTFDNAKHFESSELCAISIQCSDDIGGNAYWHVTTVVEYDWNTFLGTTSAEIDSTP
jgi:hypothetical protein